ncbi:hypothetical protein F2Q70_00004575 [Brassica cretica]|uniref:Aspartic peptidase DDI1-type domain-containing protein n=1 Tax=Brassica cretica TaxID=69181 RepID=A0A8S9IR14_BRACR|nr:hypothetical protein F2Q70_00004575 [Brassica cretica]KAF3568435.1 hypothetical protein DY000_02016673 [Brassica cretica]
MYLKTPIYHSISAIIKDDFWQVVKEEKLQEGDFDVESSMSFESSYWGRPTLREEHRPAAHHLSTVYTESVASSEKVRIMTHEEFAAKHPHPPKPYRVTTKDIDRHHEPAANRQRDSIGDRQKDLKEEEGKVPKHLKRGANDKEMDSFTKMILRIPKDKPFEEVYFTHRLWMFFRDTNETEEDIWKMFHQVREKMRQRITLKKKSGPGKLKKSGPGKFVVPCLIGGIDYHSALCDTGSSVSILPKLMASHLDSLKIEPSEDSFIFVDCSQRNLGGIIRNLELQIGAVCDMQTNKLCMTLIEPTVYYDPVRVFKQQTGYMEIGDDPGFIAVCYCDHGAEVKLQNEASIDTQPEVSIDEKSEATSTNHWKHRSTVALKMS